MIEKIRVADFSPVPFGRYPTDGNFSGQRFRREKLKNAFLNVLIVVLLCTCISK